MSKTQEEISKENEMLEKILRERRPNLKTIEDAKNQTEEKEMTVMLVDQPDRSVNLGVVGVGQCGSKIAEEFYSRGYNVLAINTATQDLKPIAIPEKQKLFLDYALGGAAKDLETGQAAAQQYAQNILDMFVESFSDSSILLLAISGGGGTGSGSAETMVKLMSQLGKPISVLYVLPLSSEDALSKHNSVQTLAKLANLAKNDVINSLIVVDNAKIELMYPGLSMAEFWKVANSSIVDPLHLFNQLSANPSSYTSLDSMDFSRVFVGTGDCALYGSMEVDNYMEDSAIAEAMITNLQNGLLSSDFDLKQTRSAGVIVTASKEILEKIPATNIEYGFAMVSKICDEGTRVFRGIYEVPGQNTIKVYSFFSGLGLPAQRVKELKDEADNLMRVISNKEHNRSATMTIDVGKTATISAADALHKKITAKNSAMGKLTQNSKSSVVIDKRRK